MSEPIQVLILSWPILNIIELHYWETGQMWSELKPKQPFNVQAGINVIFVVERDFIFKI